MSNSWSKLLQKKQKKKERKKGKKRNLTKKMHLNKKKIIIHQLHFFLLKLFVSVIIMTWFHIHKCCYCLFQDDCCIITRLNNELWRSIQHGEWGGAGGYSACHWNGSIERNEVKAETRSRSARFCVCEWANPRERQVQMKGSSIDCWMEPTERRATGFGWRCEALNTQLIKLFLYFFNLYINLSIYLSISASG